MKIPRYVAQTIRALHSRGFDAYAVGGAVRDMLLGRKPKDWDITTNALPSDVQRIFPDTIPTGIRYGTVTVISEGVHVQVTTFRSEKGFLDRRRPSHVRFERDLTTDLSRRDFTVNALAYDLRSRKVIDPFSGVSDLKGKLLQTVGSAEKRFSEDALRLLRAGRFLSELSFVPHPVLTRAAKKASPLVTKVSAERVRDEITKLLLSLKPSIGLLWMQRTTILEKILPELTKGIGVLQGGFHEYDVFKHTLVALDASKPHLSLRLALMLHDIGKPLTRTKGEGRYHFYRHEQVGAALATKILKRLRFSRDLSSEVVALIQHHLFEDEPISKSDVAVRRLMRRVGEGRIEVLLDLRKADIRGCGPRRRVTKAIERIRRKARAILAQENAMHIKHLAISGHDVIKILKIGPGPRVGEVLSHLLEEVIDQPKLNSRSILLKRLKEMC